MDNKRTVSLDSLLEYASESESEQVREIMHKCVTKLVSDQFNGHAILTEHRITMVIQQ